MNYDLRDTKVLVTGGCGLVGSNLVEKLVLRGAKVTVLDDLSEGRRENLESALPIGPVELLIGDVADPRILAGRTFDFVFHTAGHLLRKAQGDHRGAIQANVVGSYNLFEAALECGAKKLVFTSSISIFGEPRYTPVDEEHPWDGETIYGASKAWGELILRDFGRRGLTYSIIRPCNIYGPRQSPKNGAFSQVIPIWMNAILAGRPLMIYGDGEQCMDLVHAIDMAEAHVRAMECEAANGEAFNIGTGVATSANRLADLITEAMGVPGYPREYVPHDFSRVKMRCCDISKAKRLLDYQPRYTAEDGIQETAAWWKEKRDAD